MVNNKKKNRKKYALLLLVLLLVSSIGLAVTYNLPVKWFILQQPPVIELVHPSDNETVYADTTYFTWNSSDNDPDTLYHVWYADIANTFITPFKRAVDVNTSTNYTPTSFEDGHWYWRVEVTDNNSVVVSETWHFVINTNLSNSFPYLVDPKVLPLVGNTNTVFVYTVNFTDADNDSASYVNVSIDDVVYGMVEVDPSDINTSDGKQYMYNTTLGYGLHNYSFICSDGQAVNSTSLYVNPEVTTTCPVVSNPSPQNNSNGVSRVLPLVSVYISDPDGDLLNWTIEVNNSDNSSGSLEGNGSKNCSLSTLSWSTNYTWWVNVTDGNCVISRWYIFRVMAKQHIVFSNIYPANNSVDVEVHPTLSITVSQPDGEQFNLTWNFMAENGNWSQIEVMENLSNGTYTVNLSSLDVVEYCYYGWNYTWNVSAVVVGNSSKNASTGNLLYTTIDYVWVGNVVKMTDWIILLWLLIWIVLMALNIWTKNPTFGGIAGVLFLLLGVFIVVSGIQISDGSTTTVVDPTTSVEQPQYTDAVLPHNTYAYVWGLPFILLSFYILYANAMSYRRRSKA